ncbi:MAG: LysM domain-containing protein [Kiritimatiellaeota bacterium]|nr:LysM domain-containing protein [Kiritimatiellota bacterium]
MKKFLPIAVFAASTLGCGAQQSVIVGRSDTGLLVFGQSTNAIQFAGQPPVLVGADAVASAIELYEHARRQGLAISRIDVSVPRCLVMTLDDGRCIRISWREMGKFTELSTTDLASRLARLVSLLKIDQGGRVTTIDVSDSPPNLAPASQSEPKGPRPPSVIPYQVKEGDTLSSISAAFGIPIVEITKANRLGKEDQLVPGQTIKLPIRAVKRENE